jgi:hypothetical protein
VQGTNCATTADKETEREVTEESKKRCNRQIGRKGSYEKERQGTRKGQTQRRQTDTKNLGSMRKSKVSPISSIVLGIKGLPLMLLYLSITVNTHSSYLVNSLLDL